MKGRMLLASFGARRPTVDADAVARNMASDQETVARRVVEIASIEDLDDGVEFLRETTSTAVIRDDALYSGLRVTMVAQLATAQVKLCLDINFGELRASTYTAYRNGLGAAGADLPERFSETIAATVAFADPVLADLDADAGWNPASRRWERG